MIKAMVGKPSLAVMLDSEVRLGSSIIVARCLGADFVFLGRATLYGVAAAGLAGASRALAILREEIDITLGLIGCPSFDGLGSDFVMNDAGEREAADSRPPRAIAKAV